MRGLEPLDLVDHLVVGADHADGARRGAGQLLLVGGLEAGEAHEVARLIGLAQLLEPLGGDLAEPAQHVGGEPGVGPPCRNVSRKRVPGSG